jgi:hypothetical protein
MTSVIGTIQANSRTVVGDILSTAVETRRITSAPGVDTRTWGAWTPQAGTLLSNRNERIYDEARAEYRQAQRLTIRFPDTVVLSHGDQLRLADGTVWGFTMEDAGGPGSVRYVFEIELGLIASGGDRKGGL